MRSARLSIRRKRRRRALRVLIWVLVLSALPIVSYAVWQWMLDTPLFRIERLVVRGNRWVSGDLVKTKLRDVLQQNLFRLDLAAMQRRLYSLSWVDQVVLRRELPETLSIRVFEKTPLALGLNEGEGYLLDQDGEIIDAYEEAYHRSYPALLVIENDGFPDHREAYALGAGIIQSLRNVSPALADEITRLTVRGSSRVDLHLRDVGWVLCVPVGHPAENLLAYRILRERIEDEAQGVQAVDLRWAGQLVLIR